MADPTTEAAVLRAIGHPLAADDKSRFDGLCESLSAARLHEVAKLVREERAGLPIPAHALYTQQRVNAGRGEASSPIYVTPKGANGARRCTVSGKFLPVGTGPTPPQTPSAMYTSKWMLKQFTDAPEGSPARPQTASSMATSKAWTPPIDADTNRMLYERHRAAGHGWTAKSAPPAEVLNVEAEQQQQQQRQQEEEEEDAFEQQLVAEIEKQEAAAAAASSSSPQPPVDISEEAEATPPPTAEGALSAAPAAKATATSSSSAVMPPPTARRALKMRDAASYYEAASERGAPWPVRDVRPSSAQAALAAGATLSESRSRRLEANKSDIFGASEGRGHWSVGPTVVVKRGA